ncbi:MAG: hypothetical protein AAF591_20415 [Verrucomicrobiota bacterium]
MTVPIDPTIDKADSKIPDSGEKMTLTIASAERLIELMEHPPAPNARLLAAVKAAARQAFDSDDLTEKARY